MLFGVAVDDFNGDGKADVVGIGSVYGLGGVFVDVLLGNGNGTFQAPAFYSTASPGIYNLSVAVGDFNGDGKADLAVSGEAYPYPDGYVSVLLGNGDGTFQAAVIYPVGVYANSVVVGDFNGDGNVDLAVAQEGSVSLLLGNGDGTLRRPVSHAVNAAHSLAVGDFNGDGRADLAVANGGGNGVSVLLGIVVPTKVGIFRPAAFMMVAQDNNGNIAWDPGIDQAAFFGTTGDTIIYGDWDGSGTTKVGIFRSSVGMFALDMNGNGAWDPGIDTFGFFGQAGDVPIVGDWNGDGRTKVGIYRPTTTLFAMDYNGNLTYDPGTDKAHQFGLVGDTPIIGDWTGDGKAKVGVYRSGLWILDTNNNLTQDAGDTTGIIGQAGDTPLLGDWNGDGRTKVGIYRSSAGMFAEDYNGNLVWDAGVDRAGVFGAPGSTPVVGDWTGTGITRVGVFYGNGYWGLDITGNLAWDAGVRWGGFGAATGDTPVVGKWQ